MTEEEFKARLVENLRLPNGPNIGCCVTMGRTCADCWVWKSCSKGYMACARLPSRLKASPGVTICPSADFFRAYLDGKVALHNGEWVVVDD